MLAVLTRADQPDLFSILMKLFESCCDRHSFDESVPSRYWSDIEKLDLAPPFWEFIARNFGYANAGSPTLPDFLSQKPFRSLSIPAQNEFSSSPAASAIFRLYRGNCLPNFRPAFTRIRWMGLIRRWGWNKTCGLFGVFNNLFSLFSGLHLCSFRRGKLRVSPLKLTI
jgi:hypothetical protein